MTQHHTQDSQSQIKEAISYRVREEYEKYHNDVTTKYNGKDFWIEQIVWKLDDALEAYVTTRVKEAREPLVRILENSDYGKCLECGEFYHDDDMVFCEPCEENGDNSEMHEWCAGILYNGDGSVQIRGSLEQGSTTSA